MFGPESIFGPAVATRGFRGRRLYMNGDKGQGQTPDSVEEEDIARIERHKVKLSEMAGWAALGAFINIALLAIVAKFYAVHLVFGLGIVSILICAIVGVWFLMRSMEPRRSRFCEGEIVESNGREAWLAVGARMCVECNPVGKGDCPENARYTMYDHAVGTEPTGSTPTCEIQVAFPGRICRYLCRHTVVRFVSPR